MQTAKLLAFIPLIIGLMVPVEASTAQSAVGLALIILCTSTGLRRLSQPRASTTTANALS